MILSDIKQAQRYLETNSINPEEFELNIFNCKWEDHSYRLVSNTRIFCKAGKRMYELKIIKIN